MGLIDFGAVCIDSTKIKANANRRDIGTKEQLQRRYDHIEEACRKRYRQWQEATAAAAEKVFLQKKIERAQKQQKRLDCSIAFLQEHTERKRIHLADPDADWQKGNANNFIVGFNTHVAVDAKANMIVHQEVVTKQADSDNTLAMIAGVDAAKKSADKTLCKSRADAQREQEGNQSAAADVKYILDSGYSSHKNLAALKDRDVYMPDKEFASTMEGKRNPEDRPGETKGRTRSGKIRSHVCVRSPVGRLYLSCRRTTYLSAGTDQGRRFIPRIQKVWLRFLSVESTLCRHKGKQQRAFHLGAPACRDRDEQRAACTSVRLPPRRTETYRLSVGAADEREIEKRTRKKIYAHRFPVAEGTIGVIKAARGGHRFLRRGLHRVKTEWVERCIAHNMAKIMQFARA